MKAITYKEKTIDEITYHLKCFHYTSDLPVALYINNELFFSIPKMIKTAETITGKNKQHVTILQKYKNINLIENAYIESSITLELKNEEMYVSIGPFLNKKIESGLLTNMVRDGVIPFHKKTEMQEYYNSLPIFDKEKIFYIIKLLDAFLSINFSKNYKIENDEKIYNPKNELYFKQKNEYRSNKFLHSPYFIEQEISKKISEGNIENSKKLLKEINSLPHARLASTTLRSYKNSMICSCSYMTRAAIAGGVNPDEAFTLSDVYINEIEDISTIEELEKFEYKMVENFSKKVQEINNKKYSPTVLSVIYYIDDHLCEDLTIENISKEVYLNPCYLSSLFHKETGKTIVNWIKEKRIKESAHLVLNTKEEIADIAFFYNFCSQSHYIQSFKKIMGVTPGEYRNNKYKLK